MPAKNDQTLFAPAARADAQTLKRQAEFFSEAHITRHLLDAIPNILLILNEQRQIVYTNKALMDLVGVDASAMLHGMRPGEVLECAEAGKAVGGCGTSDICSTCGAVLATLAGLSGTSDVRECCITRTVNGQTQSMDLRVWVTPLEYHGERFCIFAVTDISHEKRRRTLERIFFHDLLNVAGSIRGFAELLRDYDPADKKTIFSLIHSTAERIIEEIETQRTIGAAESHELQVNPEMIASRMVLGKTVELYSHHEAARDRKLEIAAASESVLFPSDEVVLGRVLGNMVKNALEASAPGETVTIGCGRTEDNKKIEFWVHNPAMICRERQKQIFRRSFSTKGQGRGLGTYSMKLLSEYLRGEVSFSSAEGEGTTFRARYPLEMPEE